MVFSILFAKSFSFYNFFEIKPCSKAVCIYFHFHHKSNPFNCWPPHTCLIIRGVPVQIVFKNFGSYFLFKGILLEHPVPNCKKMTKLSYYYHINYVVSHCSHCCIEFSVALMTNYFIAVTWMWSSSWTNYYSYLEIS